MYNAGHDRGEEALYEVLRALRKDIEEAGGAARVSLVVCNGSPNADTVGRWPSEFHNAKPNILHIAKFIQCFGGEHLLTELIRLAIGSQKKKVVDSAAAQREIEYLRKLVAEGR